MLHYDLVGIFLCLLMWSHIYVWWRLVTSSWLKLSDWWWWLRLEVLRWWWVGIPRKLVSLIQLLRERVLILRSSSVSITETWMRPPVIGVVETATTLLRSIHYVYFYRILLLVDRYLHIKAGVLLMANHSTRSTAFNWWLNRFLLNPCF